MARQVQISIYETATKARKALKAIGCPHWPEPTSPQALAWVAGYAARQREVSALLAHDADQVSA